MKITISFSALLAVGAMVCRAQPAVQTGQGPTYYVAAVTPHSKVWQSVTWSTNQLGQAKPVTNSYTEIKTGLARQIGNQWVDTSAQIQITPTGAQATNAQHSIYLLGNINAPGAVTTITPDGKQLTSNILGLSYWDPSTTQSVFIAEITNSFGQLLPSGTQALYQDAFSSIVADVLYENSISKFEQLVILRSQLPSPQQFNMNPSTTMLQVITEFSNPPPPAITQIQTVAGLDQQLSFGAMQMGPGAAFALDSETNRVPVTKAWALLEGRPCLIEQIPFTTVEPFLASLPPPPPQHAGLRKHSKHLLAKARLPKRKVAAKSTPPLRLARKGVSGPAFALDYTLLTSQPSITLASDVTYYVSGAVNANSLTISPGTCVKFTNQPSAGIVVNGPIMCLTAPFRMATFTSKDDNSVGQNITGSTGSPTNYNGATYLTSQAVPNVDTYEYLRLLFAGTAISAVPPTGGVWHCQFVQCGTGFNYTGTSNLFLHNVLFSGCGIAVAAQTNSIVGEHVTADGGAFTDNGGETGSITNSIFTAETNLANLTLYYSFTNASSAGVYQSAGAGNYYLADASVNRNAGTTNISQGLLSAFAQKTTYPPLVYTNTVVTPVVLSPQAQRDYDTPDLGFHYDPIDYLTGCIVTNTTMTLSNGVVIGYYNNGAFWLQDDSNFVSFGGPTQRNWLVHYSLVQEQPLELAPSGSSHTTSMPINTYHNTIPAGDPSLILRFTSVAAPVGASYMLYADSGNWETASTTLQDCELWGSGTGVSLENGATSIINVQDNLFEHAACNVWTPGIAAACNNLFHSGTNLTAWIKTYFGSGSITTRDNAFDGCTVNINGTTGNNAYLNGAVVQSAVQTNDITTNLTWQAGPLGNFYQPTNSPLINKGSRGADLAALFHYTVVTNLVNNLEIKETNSVVDIGYHYVAVDGNGNPIDTNGDGIPDWLSDSNGNGQVDSGEVGWNIVGDLGLKVIITRPPANSIIP